ncbi:hypothetical protein MTR67_034759 [Solanum verrucosum]|uniref:Uncharacterized protein n=1 Tax=Solanum verrucosum TaxID=315347 RepID=A0AAF0ZLM3_SOLVR|nr:hypothetical protein MTR67_034759 [Solanum verrucosum]
MPKKGGMSRNHELPLKPILEVIALPNNERRSVVQFHKKYICTRLFPGKVKSKWSGLLKVTCVFMNGEIKVESEEGLVFKVGALSFERMEIGLGIDPFGKAPTGTSYCPTTSPFIGQGLRIILEYLVRLQSFLRFAELIRRGQFISPFFFNCKADIQ